MLQLLRPISTFILAVIMAWSLTPGDMLHILCEHEDTVHEACDLPGKVHVETPHEHCELTNFKAPFFLLRMLPQVEQAAVTPHFVQSAPVKERLCMAISQFRALRAPPVFVG